MMQENLGRPLAALARLLSLCLILTLAALYLGLRYVEDSQRAHDKTLLQARLQDHLAATTKPDIPLSQLARNLQSAMQASFYLTITELPEVPNDAALGTWVSHGNGEERLYLPQTATAKVWQASLYWSDSFAVLGRERVFGLLLIVLVGYVLSAVAAWTLLKHRYLIALEKSLAENVNYHALLQFTQMAVHDIRKPFNMVKLFFHNATRQENGEQVLTYLTQHRKELTQVLGRAELLLADILAFSASRTVQNQQSLSPQDMVADAVKEAFAAHPSPLSIRYDFRHTRKVQVDRFKLTRVLSNIITNAIQATPHHGQLWITSREREQGHASFLLLTIGNSHSYIPPHDLERLFKPFFTKGKANGTGLGLAIVHNIVTAHGGSISATSDPQTGTEFTISLPIHSVELATQAHSLPSSGQEIATATAKPQTPAREDEGDKAATVSWLDNEAMIIVVEDSFMLLDVWKDSLREIPHRCFPSASLFWQAIQETPTLLASTKIIITDMYLGDGEMTGLELATRLRQEAPHLKIVLSTDAHTEAHWIPTYFDAQIAKWVTSVDDVMAALGS